MIDIENAIYTKVVTALRVWNATVWTSGIAIEKAPTFPAVTFFEMDNFTRKQDVDLSNTADLAMIPYQADVYSDKSSTGKAECKEMRAIISGVMASNGFRQTSSTPAFKQDESLTRMTIRYTKLQDSFGI